MKRLSLLLIGIAILSVPMMIQSADTSRALQIRQFSLRIQSMKEDIREFEAKRKTYRIKKADHRVECQEDIRGANKNTLMPTILRCYRAQLTLDLEHLRKQKTHIADLPGVSQDVQSEVQGVITTLIDAISAIVDGIDTGVFTNEESLIEAKRNLMTKYRESYWTVLTHLRADHLSRWTSHLSTQLTVEIDKGTGSLLINATNILEPAKLCLSDADLLLTGVIAETKRVQASQALQAADAHLRLCSGILRGTVDPESLERIERTEEEMEEELEPEPEVVEEEPEPTPETLILPRRLERRSLFEEHESWQGHQVEEE